MFRLSWQSELLIVMSSHHQVFVSYNIYGLDETDLCSNIFYHIKNCAVGYVSMNILYDIFCKKETWLHYRNHYMHNSVEKCAQKVVH